MLLQASRMSWLISLALGVAGVILILTLELEHAYPNRPVRETIKAKLGALAGSEEDWRDSSSQTSLDTVTAAHTAASTGAVDTLKPTATLETPPTSTPSLVHGQKHDSKNILVILPKDGPTENDMGFGLDWLEKAVENRKDYADYHGYQFWYANLRDYEREFVLQPVWAKVAAISDAFERFPDIEWVWVLDSDAIIMNGTIPVWDSILSPEALNRTIIPNAEIKLPGAKKLSVHDDIVHTPEAVDPDNIYFVIAKDFNGLNAGSFFIRRNEYMSALVDMWRDPFFAKAEFTFHEQDALAHIFVAHPRILKHLGIVDQSLINDYPIGLYGEHGATPDSLVVHFAGCRFFSEECDQMFRDHWENRTVLHEHDTEHDNLTSKIQHDSSSHNPEPVGLS